ncbi:MAG TPA: hybrid sensor histidine kinase/response regulator [Phototrophicaceae bacterium]|nr:hybrid sensor histidine kinase/response regulator [Phototrophicaceae bacterium]
MSRETSPYILVVDDEPANRALLERALGGKYEVCTAANGFEALDILAHRSVDLIMLDIMMPRLNGLQTLQQIRANPEIAEIPVIIISALTNPKDITRGLELGANDYITKPLDMGVTLARIRTQLQLKQLSDERKQTIVQLRSAQEMKDHLLFIASHDLKGPVMTIGLGADLLRPYEANIPDGAAILDTIQSSLQTMQIVIEDFLETAALQNGRLDLKLNYLVIDHLISSMIIQYTAQAEKKNIVLVAEDTGGIIFADVARMQQAVGNLVSNAIKYSAPHTTIHISTLQNGETVRINVADQGPGIPLAEQPQLFTQFGKLSPRPTAGESSTGLGLWIVKHLVTLQNGRVGVECPPEGGSIFWIEMPAVAENALQ